MARSKVSRHFSIDGDVSRELTQLAEALGHSDSKLATDILREGLEQRRRRLESLAYAGLGMASFQAMMIAVMMLALL